MKHCLCSLQPSHFKRSQYRGFFRLAIVTWSKKFWSERTRCLTICQTRVRLDCDTLLKTEVRCGRAFLFFFENKAPLSLFQSLSFSALICVCFVRTCACVWFCGVSVSACACLLVRLVIPSLKTFICTLRCIGGARVTYTRKCNMKITKSGSQHTLAQHLYRGEPISQKREKCALADLVRGFLRGAYFRNDVVNL